MLSSHARSHLPQSSQQQKQKQQQHSLDYDLREITLIDLQRHGRNSFRRRDSKDDCCSIGALMGSTDSLKAFSLDDNSNDHHHDTEEQHHDFNVNVNNNQTRDYDYLNGKQQHHQEEEYDDHFIPLANVLKEQQQRNNNKIIINNNGKQQQQSARQQRYQLQDIKQQGKQGVNNLDGSGNNIRNLLIAGGETKGSTSDSIYNNMFQSLGSDLSSAGLAGSTDSLDIHFHDSTSDRFIHQTRNNSNNKMAMKNDRWARGNLTSLLQSPTRTNDNNNNNNNNLVGIIPTPPMERTKSVDSTTVLFDQNELYE